jgi:hypothetical protein
MINFFRKWFNLDKVDELNRSLEIYRERCEQLEGDVREYKGYKLKYRVAMLQNDEDEFMELLEMAKKVEDYESGDYERRKQAAYYHPQMAAQQHQMLGQAQSQLQNILGSQLGSQFGGGRWL